MFFGEGFWRGWNIGKQMIWFFHAVFEILIVLQNEYIAKVLPKLFKLTPVSFISSSWDQSVVLMFHSYRASVQVYKRRHAK